MDGMMLSAMGRFSPASREAAAARPCRQYGSEMLVGYRTVCAVPHAGLKVYRRADDSSWHVAMYVTA